jgi:quercetin dioxygenase-like cupin family protein
MNKLLLAAALSPLWAGQAIVRQPSEIEWKVSGDLPQGAAVHEYHLLYEDPTTHGVQTLVHFSKGYVLPAHRHSHDETLVVLKGQLALTIGDKTTVVKPGGYAMIPAQTAHALKALGWSGCELLVSFSGPPDFKAAQAAQ